MGTQLLLAGFFVCFSEFPAPLLNSRFGVPRQVEGRGQKLRPQFAHESMGTQLLLADLLCVFRNPPLRCRILGSPFPATQKLRAGILLERIAPMLTKNSSNPETPRNEPPGPGFCR
jgi:hypothetical protein